MLVCFHLSVKIQYFNEATWWRYGELNPKNLSQPAEELGKNLTSYLSVIKLTCYL